jgi:hypothetical protein
MFALPLPPEDSERMPGRPRKTSAIDRGASSKTSSIFTELVDTLDSSLSVG